MNEPRDWLVFASPPNIRTLAANVTSFGGTLEETQQIEIITNNTVNNIALFFRPNSMCCFISRDLFAHNNFIPL